MSDALLHHREMERQALVDRGGDDVPLKPLTVWTSTRRRTVETSQYLYEAGYRVRQRSQMSQLNPGVCEKMTERRIRIEYPDEVTKHEADPYHHRYPRAEVRHPQSFNISHGNLYLYTSRTTTWLYAWNPSFWSWSENRMIC